MSLTAVLTVLTVCVVDRRDVDVFGEMTGDLGWLPPFTSMEISSVSNNTGLPYTVFGSRATASRSDNRRAPPTGKWWQGLVHTNASTPIVNAFPLLLRNNFSTCTTEIGRAVPVVEGANVSFPFSAAIEVVLGDTTTGGCFPHVEDYDTMGVNVSIKQKANDGSLAFMLTTRGHPYVTYDVLTMPFQMVIVNGILNISRIGIAEGGSMAFETSDIDVVDKLGARYIVHLPTVTSVTAFSDGRLLFPDRTTGYVRIAHVPLPVSHHSNSTHGNLPFESFETLRKAATCIAYGADISHNHTTVLNTKEARAGRSLNLLFTFKVEPTGCDPLMMTLPHHRAASLVGPTNGDHTAELLYQSPLGELQPAIGRRWDMAIPLKPLTALPTLADSPGYAQCTEVRLFEALLSDFEKYGNGTVLATDSYGRQFYHTGLQIDTAKRLDATAQLRTLLTYSQTWFQELNDGTLAYESAWGTLCVQKVHLGIEDRTCFGSSHLQEFGEMLNGFLRLWSHLLDDEESGAEKSRMLVKLEHLGRTLARDIANMAESDEYFPVARGFDFFTGLAYDRHGVTFSTDSSPEKMREFTPPGQSLLAYQAVALLGGESYLRDSNIFLTGDFLYTINHFSAETYIVKVTEHATDGLGGVTVALSDQLISRSNDVYSSFAPFDNATETIISDMMLAWGAVDSTLETTVSAKEFTPYYNFFDISLYSVFQPVGAMNDIVTVSLQGHLNYTNATANTQTGDLEYLLRNALPEAFSCSSSYSLPIRIVGSTVWYKDSFNYFFKTMDYQPTVIGKKPTTYNMYDMDLYSAILERDVRSIKSLGFNTVLISTNTFSIDRFIEFCKEVDMNVIVSQILPEAGFAGDKFKAEDDFITMLEYLSGHTNIVMWSVNSDALSSITDSYDYYVLLRKLRLLRDTYDTNLRPIVIPLTEFTLPKLTADKTLYDKAVEMAILTTMNIDATRLEEDVTYLSHPVIVNFESDSWNYVNKTEEEVAQADYLQQEIAEVTPLSTKQLLSGIVITEWVDQYWRGEDSDPDFDCPDPSSYRHSICGKRVAELWDGMLTSEYMGVNEQYQTWFKHCVRHKAAYYMFRGVFGGYVDPEEKHEDCVFVNLTWDFWVLVIVVSAAAVFIALCLVVMAICQEETSADDAGNTVEDEELARWVQPDTDKIYELIMSGTANMLEQRPFIEMDIQRMAGVEEDAMEEEQEEEVEVDSWEFCRWQVVIIQLDRLQKIIFDEMLCQIRLGDYGIVGEHSRGFAHAVASLHARYCNSYLGWLDHQASKGEKTKENLGLDRTHSRWEIKFIFDEDDEDMHEEDAERSLDSQGEPRNQSTRDSEDDMPYLVPLLPEEEDLMEQALAEGLTSFNVCVKGIDYVIQMDEIEEEEEDPKKPKKDKKDKVFVEKMITGRVYEENPFPEDADDDEEEEEEEAMKDNRLLLVGTIRKRTRCGLGTTTNDQLIDLLCMFCIWQLGEQMTWFNGHWLSWCFHYTVKHMKLPPSTIVNDARHFCQRTVTMDDIDESCSITPYFDIEGTRGIDERDNVLMNKDGTFNAEELKRFPFQKTFREPLRWGIVFAIIHNIYFIFHTQIVAFIFWGFVVNISGHDQKLVDEGISAMFKRMDLVFFRSPDDLYWIMTMTSKVDFWLLIFGEILDLWMLGGLYHYTSQDWKPTFNRVHFADYVKLRWSAYTSIIAFVCLMQDAFYDDKSASGGKYILSYVAIRVVGILVNNLILVMFPIKQRGAPRKGQSLQRKGAVKQFFFALMFWVLVYGSVQIAQAWIMFRTETVGWDFCECDNQYDTIVNDGAGEFFHDFFGRMVTCAEKEPRCFTAVFLIWVTAMALFIVLVNAGFLVWVVIFGSFTHFASQWLSKKTRTLTGKKIQTAYILRSLNVKMLGFTDPRDTQVARKVWNRIIKEMWDEWLISAFEYENLLIHTHVSEVQFALKNDFAMERLSNFLQYIQAEDDEELGPCSSYPSISIVVPVYGEDLVCAAANTAGAFNEKIRSHQQEFTQLSFLIDSYHDEWVNFVEHCILDEEFFYLVLDEEQIEQMQQNVEEVKDVTDEKQKRDMKGDRQLRNACADIISDKIHTQPHLFYEEELIAVQWWASMHMQTVARTVRGMERKREAFRFLLELEHSYTHTEKTRQDKIDLLTDDKVQIVLALQNLANNKWFSKNESGLMLMWERFPKVEVSFVIETLNYRNSPTVVRKVHEHVEDLWDCTKYLSCLALWSDEEEDWQVVSAYARRNTLRLEKNARYGLNGLLQGKAVNQHHSLAFTRGQLIEAIDCNQDGYFDEALKMRTVLGKFFPTKDRTWSQFKIVGFPEYSITAKSGIIGRIASYSEYIFVNLFQKVLAHPLNVRMHYGHPDFFDFSWCIQQGGMSKSNPLINLNEDIFAGFHVTHAGERVDHVMWMRDGKGRETNFDGANGFQIKLAFGASMQFRTRDQYELMRTSDVLRRHSILYGSVGPYIYLITIVVLIYTTLLINISLAYAAKTDYSLSSRGSPYGSEWMVQMSLIESVPLLLQLTLDYGLVGLFTYIRDVVPTTLYFLFIIMTRFSYFIQSCLNGAAAYIATGRTDPLFRRSLRHIYRYYGTTHFMPGMFLLAIVLLYIDVEPRSITASLMRTLWHWGVAISFIVTPCVFNPALNLAGLWEDLKSFYLWVFGDIMEKIKKQKDVLTKRSVKEKKDAFWEKAYDQLTLKLHPAHQGASQGGTGTEKSRSMSNVKEMYRGSGMEDDEMLAGIDHGTDSSQPQALNFRFRESDYGDEVSSSEESSEGEYIPETYPWTDQYDPGPGNKRKQSPTGDDELEAVEFSTMMPLPKYSEHSAPPIYVGTIVKGEHAYHEHAMPGAQTPEEEEMLPTDMMMFGDLPPPPTSTVDPPSPEMQSMVDPPSPEMQAMLPQITTDFDKGSVQSSPRRPEGSEGELTVMELPSLLKPSEHDELSNSMVSGHTAPSKVMHTLSDMPPDSARTGNSSSSRLNIPPPSHRPQSLDGSSFVSLPQSGNGKGGFMSVSNSNIDPADANFPPTQQYQQPLNPPLEPMEGTDYGEDDDEGAMVDTLVFERPEEDTELSDSFLSSHLTEERVAMPALSFGGIQSHGQRSSRTQRAGPMTARPPATARLVANKAVANKQEALDDVEFDFDWLDSNEKNKADLERYLKMYRVLPGNVRGASTHGGRVPNKTIEWKAMQSGFMKLGKIVDDASCKELMLGLGVREIDFVQFVILFHKSEGKESGHGDYGIDRAVTDINRARHRELRHIQKQMARGRKGYLKTKNEAQKIAVLTVLHNTRRQFKVEFRCSTEDKSLVKANTLKHHWKVTQIMLYRRSSTISSFLFSLLLLAVWLFAYFSLWEVWRLSPTIFHPFLSPHKTHHLTTSPYRTSSGKCSTSCSHSPGTTFFRSRTLGPLCSSPVHAWWCSCSSVF